MIWQNLRKPVVMGILLLLSCAGSVSCLAILFTFPTPRAARVNLNDLLLEVSSFPPDTEVWEGPSKLPRDPSLDLDSEDNRAIDFKLVEAEHLTNHFIFKFPNALNAWWAYGRAQRSGYFQSTELSWQTPVGWSYKSPIADDFTFKCVDTGSFFQAKSRPLIRCAAVVRYGEIISEFSTPLVPGVMELDDVERILREIDNRMAEQLN